MQQSREQWKSRTGFIMAAVGSAIGLGNLWRFPYMAYENGGGAFLIPYVVALATAGLPLMLLEYGVGRKMHGSAPTAYSRVHAGWEWLGWWSVLFVMFGIVLYYNVILSWCLHYFLCSATMPWKNDPNGYFFRQYLDFSGNPGDVWPVRTIVLLELVVIWFINWAIAFQGVQNGIERASKIFLPILVVLTSILVFWGVTLEGAGEGLRAYLRPDFGKLLNFRVWIDAYGQIFFTLSIGFGIMIAYASYLPRRSNLHSSALITCLLNSCYSIFAGVAVFATLGYMSHATGKPLDDVVDKGIGLAFVAYPQAIDLIPKLPHLFSAIFFLALVLAGLTSSMSILEAFTSALMDKFGFNRRRSVTALCCIGFAGSVIFTTRAGLSWVDILDHFITSYGLISVGVLESILVGWVLGPDKIREFINEHSRLRLGRWWNFVIRYFIPGVLGLILVRSLLEDSRSAYGDYPWYWVLLIGVTWLLGLLLLSFVFARRRSGGHHHQATEARAG